MYNISYKLYELNENKIKEIFTNHDVFDCFISFSDKNAFFPTYVKIKNLNNTVNSVIKGINKISHSDINRYDIEVQFGVY